MSLPLHGHLCARNRYYGLGQLIISHIYCGCNYMSLPLHEHLCARSRYYGCRKRCDLEDLVCSPIESLVLEMYIRKEKWLFICMYSPNTKYKHICCDVLDSLLDTARSNAISNIHVLADLNINLLNTIESKCLDVVIETHGLKNVITEPTCHKSSNATLIDVILTSNCRRIAGTLNTDIGLSDYHNLVAFSTKLHLPRLTQKVQVQVQIKFIATQ